MRKFALAALVLVCLAANTQAGVVLQKFLGNGDNVLKDNSVGQLSVSTSATDIAVGDIIQGIVRLDQNTQGHLFTAGANDQLIIAYSFTLVAGTHGAQFDFAPTTTAGFTLKDMLPAQIAANLPGQIFAVLDGSTSVNPTDLTLAAADAALNNTLVYSLDLIGGIGAGDYLGGKLDTTSLADIATNGQITPFGTERGGLSVLLNNTVDIFHPLVSTTPYTGPKTLHDIGYSGSLFGPTTDNATNGYAFSDSTNVEVNVTVTPEPASMVMWGIGFGIAAVVAYRRRKA